MKIQLFNFKSLRTKLLLYFVVIVLVPILAAGAITIEIGRTIIRDETFQRLNVIAEQKAIQVNRVFDYPDLEEEIEFITEQSETEIISQLISLKDSDISQELLDQLQPLVSPDDDFAEVFLIDPESGLVFASSNPKQIGLPGSTYAINVAEKVLKVESAIEEDDLLDEPEGAEEDDDEDDSQDRNANPDYIYDYYMNPTYSSASYTLAVPVFDEAGQQTAIYGVHIYQHLIESSVGNLTGLGSTGQAYLVNKDFKFTTNNRFYRETDNDLITSIIASENYLNANDLQGEYVNYRGDKVYGVLRNLDYEDLRLLVEINKSEAQAPLTYLWEVVLSVSALVLIGLLILAILSAKQFLTPIQELANGVNRFGQGQLDSRIVVKSADEIGLLATTFNNMAQRLKDDIEKLEETDKIKSEFIKITSHNLRTPASIIRGYVESLNDASTIEEVKDMSASLKVGSDRLSALIQDIVTISELEKSDNLLKSRHRIDMVRLIDDLVLEFKERAQQADVKFIVNLPVNELFISGQQTYLRIAVWNILDNAFKFLSTDHKSYVSVNLQVTGGMAKLIVSDNGVGIPEQELKSLFTKFHKATDSESGNFEGVGIGLFVSKKIIDQHGGTITASSKQINHEFNTVFVISLPLSDSK